ncbi:aluminum-activated malate transporter 2-like [Eucalyptus grandis]|uniref:aluminum-activated malate transporter 2-like n=1 Tax=Eucalyptus grandis TaxID=71139 RepID=UPI00192EEC80|nr:aluminum-activated malate transporter 2-like [Eucalyptus grandis]
MEMAIFYDNEKAGPFMRGCISVKALPKKICVKMISITMRAKELGQDHPRKIIHYLKVRLALTLVSLFYYFRLLHNGFGVNAIWTVLTVVVMFKFSIVALVTFTRFPPEMKTRHDSGLIVFDLTFCMVFASGYQENQAITIACQRASTIILSSFTAILVCIFICPVWSGEQLQDLIAPNMDKLGFFLEECQLKISEAVNELAFLAHFKCAEPGALRSIERRHMTHQGSIQLLSDHGDETLQPLLDEDMTHRMITIEGQPQSSSKNENASRPAGENG